MKIFVTGASGFVGQAVVTKLLDAGHDVRALSHRNKKSPEHPRLTMASGDTTDFESLKNTLEGCDAVIHLVGIIREFPAKGITFERLHTESTRNILAAARDQGLKRYLHMSANGARKQGKTVYHRTKWAAEELVRKSGLDWTIFRPSLIYGPGDAFINMLAGLIRRLPVVPVFGDGNYQLQPVHVDDVAKAFTAALDRSACFGQTYCCCGPRVYSYDQLLDIIARALNKKTACKLHHPLALIRPLVNVMQSFPLFPITGDQLQMLLEGNTCQDDSRWTKELKIEPALLEEAIEDYLK